MSKCCRKTRVPMPNETEILAETQANALHFSFYLYGLIRYKNSYGFGVDMLRALIYAAAHFLHMCKIYGKITRA